MKGKGSTLLEALTFAALAVYVSSKDCGQTSFNGTGSVTLPSDLAEGENCTWIVYKGVTNTGAMAVYLTDTSINTGDTLVIKDGQRNVINFSGNSAATLVAAAFDNATTIVFTVGKNNSMSRGKIDFNTEECLAVLTNPLVLRVSEPRVNQTQPGDVNCTYQVINPMLDSRRDVVSFVEFNMTEGSSVKLTSGENTLTAKGGDASVQPDFFSDPTSDSVFVNFFIKQAQATTPTEKVALAVQAFLKSCTGDDQPSTNETVTWQPELPDSPSVVYECLYRLTHTAPSPTSEDPFLVRVKDLELSPSDTLTLVDGDTRLGQPLAQLQGSVAPGYLSISASSSVVAHLTLSSTVSPRALNVSFEPLRNGGRLTGKGVLKAGNAGTSQLDAEDTLTAYFQLVATDGQEVSLSLQTPLTNDSTLTLYRGMQVSDGVLITLGSDALTKGLQTVVGHSQMLVVLDKFPATDNFTALFSSVPAGCDQLATLPTGQLSLDTATLGSQCTWTIAPSAQGVTVLTFDTLSLDGDTSVKVFTDPAHPIASFKGPDVASPFPQITVAQDKPVRVSVSHTGKNQSTSKVTVSYKVVPQVCGGPLTGPQGSLSTPNFPNQYPLNSQCVWTQPQSSQPLWLYLSFRKMDLTQNHSITVTDTDNTTLETLATYKGSANSSAYLPEDLLVEAGNTTAVTFSSVAQGPSTTGPRAGPDTNSVGTGALLDYWVLDCGGNMSQSANGSLASPGYPKTSTAPTSCRWIIQLPALSDEDDGSDAQTVQFKVTAKGAQVKNIHKYLKIYDGPGIRYPLSTANATNGTSGSVLSRYASLTVIYNLDKGVKDQVAFNLTFTRYVCNASEQCANGICMHPDWVCNYKDDCGDGTDEQNCVFPRPTPPPQPPQSYSGWVKIGWVPASLVIGILLGAAMLFILPRIVRRLRGRGGSYNRMSDDTPVIA